MTTQNIYDRFQTPENLQEHMLKVGAVSQILCEQWKNQVIDTSSVIQACLLHDIAKPLNFDLAKQAQFGLSESDIQKLADLQKLIREKYDAQEHQAAVKICKEVGCSSAAVEIVDDLEWEYTARLLQENKPESLIAIYCDMRISPKGIMPLIDRLNELKTRDHDANRMDELSIAGQQLEKWIQQDVAINVQDITDADINSRIEPLRSFEF